MIDSPEDFFCTLRDHLLVNLETNEQYNELKRRFEGTERGDYRAAKSTFMEALLDLIRAK